MKICISCNENKDFLQFRKDQLYRDGYENRCRPCKSYAHRQWRLKNENKVVEYRKNYYLANKEKTKAQVKEYVNKNVEIIKIRRHKYNTKNRHSLFLKRMDPKKRYKRSVISARLKKVRWEISENDYIKLISAPCSYCNNELRNVQISTGIGLDRIDNDKKLGYTLSNVLPCCSMCNKIKNNFLTVEETKAAVQVIVNIRKNQRQHV